MLQVLYVYMFLSIVRYSSSAVVRPQDLVKHRSKLISSPDHFVQLQVLGHYQQEPEMNQVESQIRILGAIL
jgi:hypothetical protein